MGGMVIDPINMNHPVYVAAGNDVLGH